MKKITLVLVLLLGFLSSRAMADEIFYATANTGVQTVGSTIDLVGGPQFSFSIWWIAWSGQSIEEFGSYGPTIEGFPGDPNATLVGAMASNWILHFSNWTSGSGYATIDIDTNYPAGTYYVGNVNCTGQVIWVVLQ